VARTPQPRDGAQGGCSTEKLQRIVLQDPGEHGSRHRTVLRFSAFAPGATSRDESPPTCASARDEARNVLTSWPTSACQRRCRRRRHHRHHNQVSCKSRHLTEEKRCRQGHSLLRAGAFALRDRATLQGQAASERSAGAGEEGRFRSSNAAWKTRCCSAGVPGSCSSTWSRTFGSRNTRSTRSTIQPTLPLPLAHLPDAATHRIQKKQRRSMATDVDGNPGVLAANNTSAGTMERWTSVAFTPPASTATPLAGISASLLRSGRALRAGHQGQLGASVAPARSVASDHRR